MKILFYLEKAPVRGGIEIFAERHAAELRAAGNIVDFVSEVPDGFGEWDQIVVHKCSSARTLEKFPPEKTVLYVHDHEPVCPRRHAWTPFRRNCRRPGGVWPCLFCAPLSRDWREALSRVFSQGRRRRAMARMGRVVVLSRFMARRLAENGVPEERISVEPPEIAPGPGGSADSAPPRGGVDLLFVGQLLRGKGVHVLLRAMSLARVPRTLDVVGTGNMEGVLRDMARKLGLEERIRFRGFVTNPSAWMEEARCVVVPSVWQEPFGLVAAEAVALGRRVIASDVGGLPEACAGRATLVPPGDADALAAALDALPAEKQFRL